MFRFSAFTSLALCVGQAIECQHSSSGSFDNVAMLQSLASSSRVTSDSEETFVAHEAFVSHSSSDSQFWPFTSGAAIVAEQPAETPAVAGDDIADADVTDIDTTIPMDTEADRLSLWNDVATAVSVDGKVSDKLQQWIAVHDAADQGVADINSAVAAAAADAPTDVNQLWLDAQANAAHTENAATELVAAKENADANAHDETAVAMTGTSDATSLSRDTEDAAIATTQQVEIGAAAEAKVETTSDVHHDLADKSGGSEMLSHTHAAHKFHLPNFRHHLPGKHHLPNFHHHNALLATKVEVKESSSEAVLKSSGTDAANSVAQEDDADSHMGADDGAGAKVVVAVDAAADVVVGPKVTVVNDRSMPPPMFMSMLDVDATAAGGGQ